MRGLPPSSGTKTTTLPSHENNHSANRVRPSGETPSTDHSLSGAAGLKGPARRLQRDPTRRWIMGSQLRRLKWQVRKPPPAGSHEGRRTARLPACSAGVVWRLATTLPPQPESKAAVRTSTTSLRIMRSVARYSSDLSMAPSNLRPELGVKSSGSIWDFFTDIGSLG